MNAAQVKQFEALVRKLFGVIARGRLMEQLSTPAVGSDNVVDLAAAYRLIAAQNMQSQAVLVWRLLFEALEMPTVDRCNEDAVDWLRNWFKIRVEAVSRIRHVPEYYHVKALLDIAEVQCEGAERIYRLVNPQ